VLPRPAVALLGGGPTLLLAVLGILTLAHVDAPRYVQAPIVLFALGYAWCGAALWRERAFEPPRTTGGIAAA
jgi:hypothetical protein